MSMTFEDMPKLLIEMMVELREVRLQLTALANRDKDDKGNKITKEEALSIVRVTMQTLSAWMRESDIPVYYSPKGRPYFFDRELKEWMSQNGNNRRERADEVLHRLAKKRAS